MRISDWSSDVCSSDLKNICNNNTFREALHVVAVSDRSLGTGPGRAACGGGGAVGRGDDPLRNAGSAAGGGADGGPFPAGEGRGPAANATRPAAAGSATCFRERADSFPLGNA